MLDVILKTIGDRSKAFWWMLYAVTMTTVAIVLIFTMR